MVEIDGVSVENYRKFGVIIENGEVVDYIEAGDAEGGSIITTIPLDIINFIGKTEKSIIEIYNYFSNKKKNAGYVGVTIKGENGLAVINYTLIPKDIKLFSSKDLTEEELEEEKSKISKIVKPIANEMVDGLVVLIFKDNFRIFKGKFEWDFDMGKLFPDKC